MFCPKCGSRNEDGTRFCRGCGADVGNVIAAVEERSPADLQLAEKQIDLYGRGWRGLIGGLGFLIVAGVSFGISIKLAVLGVFALAFATVFLSTGISRLVQANALKRLRERKTAEPPQFLSPGDPDYLRPLHSIYATDDLVRQPGSITEQTTTHLELNPEPKIADEQAK